MMMKRSPIQSQNYDDYDISMDLEHHYAVIQASLYILAMDLIFRPERTLSTASERSKSTDHITYL
jgi:hypothetical protein